MTSDQHRRVAGMIAAGVLCSSAVATPAVATPADGGPAPSGPVTTASPSDRSLPDNAIDYADAFVRAWGSDDRDRMQELGIAEATEALPAAGGDRWRQTSADAGWGKVYVSYDNVATGDELTVLVRNERAAQGKPKAVRGVNLSQHRLPSSPGTYADKLIIAWGAGAAYAEQRYATRQVIDDLGDSGRSSWRRVALQGAAGSSFVTYRQSGTGRELVLQVSNQTASESGTHAVQDVRN